MKVTCHPEANVAYVRFCEQQGTVETIRLTEDFLVDVDESGVVCGVELLNANKQRVAGDDGALLVVAGLSGDN